MVCSSGLPASDSKKGSENEALPSFLYQPVPPGEVTPNNNNNTAECYFFPL